jgi:hypothetical protein
MHWFWRATIAVAISLLTFLGLRYLIFDLYFTYATPNAAEYKAITISTDVLYAVVVLSVCRILTYRYGPKHIDSETRCRKCGYILRGISEPRCPECGERI